MLSVPSKALGCICLNFFPLLGAILCKLCSSQLSVMSVHAITSDAHPVRLNLAFM